MFCDDVLAHPDCADRKLSSSQQIPELIPPVSPESTEGLLSRAQVGLLFPVLQKSVSALVREVFARLFRHWNDGGNCALFAGMFSNKSWASDNSSTNFWLWETNIFFSSRKTWSCSIAVNRERSRKATSSSGWKTAMIVLGRQQSMTILSQVRSSLVCRPLFVRWWSMIAVTLVNLCIWSWERCGIDLILGISWRNCSPCCCPSMICLFCTVWLIISVFMLFLCIFLLRNTKNPLIGGVRVYNKLNYLRRHSEVCIPVKIKVALVSRWFIFIWIGIIAYRFIWIRVSLLAQVDSIPNFMKNKTIPRLIFGCTIYAPPFVGIKLSRLCIGIQDPERGFLVARIFF